MKDFRELTARLFGSKGKRTRKRLLAAMMAIAVFCTTYSLILPAITLDSQTAESEPGIEAELPAEETLGEVQDADLLLEGQNPGTASVDTDSGTAAADSASGTDLAGAAAETNSAGAVSETNPAGAAAETSPTGAASETQPVESAAGAEEAEEAHASSPLIYHCDHYDIELRFDSDKWKLPVATELSVRELRKDAEEDSEEYQDYQYYDGRAREELSDRDEDLAESADTLHYYEFSLKADGEDLSMPEGKTDIIIKYHSDDQSNYNSKTFGDEETILASLFWLVDWHTNLIDKNADDSAIYTIKNHHLKEIHIKDLNLSDFDNVIGLFACPDSASENGAAAGSAPSDSVTSTSADGTATDKATTNTTTKPETTTSTADKTDTSTSIAGPASTSPASTGTLLEKCILSGGGQNYRISVTYGPETGIPADADLSVEELTRRFSDYDTYVANTENALGMEEGSAGYIRLFDIKIVDKKDPTLKYQPAEGTTADVRIELADAEDGRNLQVVHFPDEAPLETSAEKGGQPAEDAQIQIMDSVSEVGDPGQAVSFATGGFSVYGVVDVPEPAPQNIERFTGDDPDGQTLLISNKRGSTEFYLGNEAAKANWMKHTAEIKIAQPYKFTKITEGSNAGKYTISIEKEGEAPQYLELTNSALQLSDQPCYFDVYKDRGVWLLKTGSNNFVNQNDANGFTRWQSGYSDAGNRMILTYPPEVVDDPAGLDGREVALINFKDGISGTAMMSGNQNNNTRLTAKDLLVRTNPLNRNQNLFIAKDSDASLWKFENISGNQYYITTTVDGSTKYLKVTNSSVSLSDIPDAACVLNVDQGTGEYAGKIRISNAENYSPNLYSGKTSNGFGSYSDGQSNEWFNIAELSSLTEEDFAPYSAYKVSISDKTNVPDGTQLVIYTRVWNDAKKEYEFYAIDHDGNLVQAFESGDKIEWIGVKVNTMLWDFTEHHYSGTNNPNFYYDFQNTYSQKYLSPKIESEEVLSDTAPGVNLNGRRYGYYYSTILAWDDPYYEYAGYKVENGKLVSCPISEADDFYFAVMNPIQQSGQDELTTVATVDNNDYGITMKMIDYNNAKTDKGRYDTKLTEVMGDKKEDKTGLVTSYLEEGGYPSATATGTSLQTLFDGAAPANHLFIESIHQQSGYFEFNSTRNFAHLEEGGDFTVYNQIATIESGNDSLWHGQFMPYNTITPGLYSQRYTNETDELDLPLSDNDPRKGEQLYAIPHSDANFHFGMEMEASFTQTADGLDAWGHDIIFEFAGDDDMWLYVDGVLVLDLGGTHAANTGKVNFRTGEVVMNRKDGRSRTTDLRTLFRESYLAQYPDGDVEAWLNGIFKDGGTVFQDYSAHTMKMLYLERGAGASNLHMRFNLAAIKKGTVVLNKKLSGAESESNSLLEFPYQIYYRTEGDGGDNYHLLTEKNGESYNVTYKDTVNPVTYQPELTLGEETYSHVFFLRAGESAVIDLPDDTIDYYIVECGINTAAFDQVKANGEKITGTGTANPGRFDYQTSAASMTERAEVTYDNHVKDGAMKTLSITKKLYDETGDHLLPYPDDPTTFTFRLYLGDIFTGEENMPLANLYPYFVKDPAGNYCRWDAVQQKFVSLDVTDYDTLVSEILSSSTNNERTDIIFHTSPNGSISKIPSGYTVEVRDLLVGTYWKVEERDREIPRGYTLRLADGYTRTDTGTEEKNGTTPIGGTMGDTETDPRVDVRNQKGWGLTVDKVWTDKDFLIHDPIYFAVYYQDELVADSVRELRTGETEIYYFFGQEQMNGRKFSDYVVREVTITAPDGYTIPRGEDGFVIPDENGAVKATQDGGSGEAADPICQPIDEGGTLTLGGTPVGTSTHQTGYTYTVHYEQGEQTTENANVRTDQVTNSRPGIILKKQDWAGAPLFGAVFTLKDSEGNDAAQATYTSHGEDGLITIAYLKQGTYTLTEIGTPTGYTALDSPITIEVGEDKSVQVSSVDPRFYTVETTEEEMTTITIKNRPTDLKVVKINSGTKEPLEGVHFALYRQVEDHAGNPMKDYNPLSGYEDLATDEQGILIGVDISHPGPGTYYLTETRAAEGFEKLENDIILTIGKDGKVTINSAGHAGWLTSTEYAQSGKKEWTLTIPNGEMKKIRFLKVDIGSTDTTLAGAEFDLYPVVDGSRAETAQIEGLISAADGLLTKNGETAFMLPTGTYQLIETKAPTGYVGKTAPVEIIIHSEKDENSVDFDEGTTIKGVTYDEGTTLSSSGSGIRYDASSKVYTLKISNSTGCELPSTGGAGTRHFSIIGAMMIGAALGAVLLRRRRQIV